MDKINIAKKDVSIQKFLGENIKALRESKGISQEELALKIGYKNRATICKIEAGQRNVELNTIDKIATVLGVTSATLCNYNGNNIFKNIDKKMVYKVDSDVKTVAESPIQYSTAYSSESLEFLPYLDKASDEIKAIIRKILDMPAKEEKILRDRTV